MPDNLKKTLEEIKISKINKKNKLSFGPLNKTKETILFEEIINDIISDRAQKSAQSYINAEQQQFAANLEAERNNIIIKQKFHKSFLPPEHVTFDAEYIDKVNFFTKDDQLLITRDNTNINLSKLIQGVNFNHISISESDLNKYENLYENNSKLNFKILSKEQFQERINKVDSIQQENLEQLTYAEKLAVYNYTSQNYKNINGLLRGHLIPHDPAITLINTAIASYGLNKVPEIKLPIVVRHESEIGVEQKIKKVKTGDIETALAFTSTAYEPQKGFGNVQIIYEDIKGKNISALSFTPAEQEYLIPPTTQIKYTGHKVIDGKHVFTSQGVNVLVNEKTPEEIARNEIDRLIDSTCEKVTTKSISTSELLDFNKNVAQIVYNNGLISEKVYQKYIDTNNDKLIKKDIKEVLSFSELNNKDKFKIAAYNLFNTTGLKSFSEKLSNKLSPEAKQKVKFDDRLNSILKKVKGDKKEQKKQSFVEKLESSRNNTIRYGKETSIK